MRCREIRSEIEKVIRRENDINLALIEEHIQQCTDCYREYKAAVSLAKTLNLCTQDDKTNLMPLEERRKLVVAQAAQAAAQAQNNSIFGHRHRVSFGKVFASLGVVMAAALVTILTIIPFKYDTTIGYEVAFAGLDRELIEDNNIICDLLYELGLRDADVDVQGCNVTCSLLIIDLKSKEEAEMVISAVNQIGTDNITSNVIPVHKSETSTILNRANKEILD